MSILVSVPEPPSSASPARNAPLMPGDRVRLCTPREACRRHIVGFDQANSGVVMPVLLDAAALPHRVSPLLTQLVGAEAVPHPDQVTAIRALVAEGRRVLVVQR